MLIKHILILTNLDLLVKSKLDCIELRGVDESPTNENELGGSSRNSKSNVASGTPSGSLSVSRW